jgi:hypothetical protein
MTKPELVAFEILKTIRINVYDKRRTQEIVDARSLYCYILRNDFKMTLFEVRDSIIAKGRSYDHATVLHSERMYNEVISRKPHLSYIRDNILGLISPKYSLIKTINGLDDDQIKIIEQCVNNNL